MYYVFHFNRDGQLNTCTILYYTILYYTILCYNILYHTILYYTILYYTILYYTILYYTILYYTRICIILYVGGDIISQLRGNLASFFEETSRMLSSFLDREISYASKHPGISY